tara:strand:+ start:598 stop:2121 length:1524 start_codon:yes stop_codon:yes gene_type:complete
VDEDAFDSPSYGADDIEFDDNNIVDKIKPAQDLIKKNLKVIVIALVVLVVAWFAYDFFIGSMREATIVIQNTEGERLPTNRLKLLDSAGNELKVLSKQSSYTEQLKAGSYRYEVSVSEYATERGTLTVTSSGETYNIIVEKELDIEILDFKEVFPSDWITGQSRDIMFEIKSDESVAKSIDIVFEEALADWSIPKKNVIVQANSTQTVVAKITVPKDITDKITGESFDAVARIKFTNEKQSKSFKVFPAPKIDLKLSGMQKNAEAGETITKPKIKVDNDSKFPIQEFELIIEITSASKNNPSKVIEWFKFQEKAGEAEAWKINVPGIESRDDVEKTIRIDIPLTAKKETITGKIVLNASFLPQPMEQTFNITIDKEANFALTLTASDEIKIDWSETIGGYETLAKILKVKNSGQLDLSNIRISVNNSLVCSTDWMEIVNPSIESLASGDSREITLNVSAPIAQRGNEDIMPCQLKYLFDNPLAEFPGEDDFIGGDMENLIRIEPQLD